MDESYNSHSEATPSLPNDPTEAAEEMQSLWSSRGGWQKQKPWDELDEGEKVKEKVNRERYSQRFTWLAEMFRSEMLWIYEFIKTNHGVIHCFRFSPQYDSPDEIVFPNAYVYFPNNDERLEEGLLISKSKNGWRKENLKELNDKYLDAESY